MAKEDGDELNYLREDKLPYIEFPDHVKIA